MCSHFFKYIIQKENNFMDTQLSSLTINSQHHLSTKFYSSHIYPLGKQLFPYCTQLYTFPSTPTAATSHFSRLESKKRGNINSLRLTYYNCYSTVLAETAGGVGQSQHRRQKGAGTYLISDCPHGFFLERLSRSLPYFSSIDALQGTEEKTMGPA